ncbi:BlaI/MecI/CopY family transcriptional regulator [Ascidiimonas sp. W6]|uniref:BlaI/MecI/CopY family transcriptional regulator n=1 Tax=Ascidiimonas meishanensis TaxID=3128903 RepID=UPI0030EEE632
MITITNKEEEVMKVLWQLEKAFVKDILEVFPEPKPHYNTLSTMVRNLEEKGYVGHEAFGKTHRYFPIVSKETYRANFMHGAMKDFFNNSYKSMVSHFAKEEKISVEELKEIIKLIENKQ